MSDSVHTSHNDLHRDIAQTTARVDGLERSFADFARSTRENFKTISDSIAEQNRNLSAFIKEQQAQPRAIPFKEIAATIAACFAIFMYFSTWIDSKITSALEKPRYQIERLERYQTTEQRRAAVESEKH